MDDEIKIIEEQLMDKTKFRKMVAESSMFEIPAFCFSILGVMAVVLLIYDYPNIRFAEAAVKQVLLVVATALIFVGLTLFRNRAIKQKLYSTFIEKRQILIKELFFLGGSYAFYVKNDRGNSFQSIEKKLKASDLFDDYTDSFFARKKLRHFMQQNFGIEISRVIHTEGIKSGMIVRSRKKRERLIFCIVNHRGEYIHLYNLDKIEDLQLRNVHFF